MANVQPRDLESTATVGRVVTPTGTNIIASWNAEADFILLGTVGDNLVAPALAPATAVSSAEGIDGIRLVAKDSIDAQHKNIAIYGFPKSMGWTSTWTKVYASTLSVFYLSLVDAIQSTVGGEIRADYIAATAGAVVYYNFSGGNPTTDTYLFGVGSHNQHQNRCGFGGDGIVDVVGAAAGGPTWAKPTMSPTTGYYSSPSTSSAANAFIAVLINPKPLVTADIFGNLSFNGQVSSRAFFFESIVGTLSFLGSSFATLFFDRVLSGVLSISGIPNQKAIWKRFYSGFLSVQATLTWNITYDVVVSGLINFSSSLKKKTSKYFYSLLSFSQQLLQTLQITRILEGTLSFSKNIKEKFFKVFESALTLAGDVLYTISLTRFLSGTLSFSTRFLRRLVARLVAEIQLRMGISGEEVAGQIEMFVTSTDNPVDIEVRR